MAHQLPELSELSQQEVLTDQMDHPVNFSDLPSVVRAGRSAGGGEFPDRGGGGVSQVGMRAAGRGDGPKGA